MNDFAKTIYEKFFMRDLVGKIVPGAIIFFTAYTIILKPLDLQFSFPEYLNWLVGVILFASFLIIGLCVQMFGELLGLHSTHPKPLQIFFIRTKHGKKARELFDDRREKIQHSSNITDSSKDQREHFVVLKEGSGNTAVALFISFLVFNTKFSFKTNWQFYLIILILSILRYWSHLVHRSRQAYHEIKVLKLKGRNNYDEESIEKYIGRKL